ncbi:MAG: MarR family transcriptional regulator [Desulfobacteraceae bacterium]|nr:MarR family transcriptional regulator [Desulfobacteraceae bacterium]
MNDRSKSFGYRFALLYRLICSLSSEKMNRLGISTSQIPFLSELFLADGPLTQDQLSKRVVIDKAATARGLMQLENLGLVVRKVNPENRRQKLVSPTPKARELETDFYNALRSSSEIFVRGFSKAEKEQALSLLDRMMENGKQARYGDQGNE